MGLVGRWTSGAPVSLNAGGDPGPNGVTNDFGFANRSVEVDGKSVQQSDDTDGLICPRGAHIRKVNPRDLTTDKGPARRMFIRLLLRRGITYDATETTNGTPRPDKGLLFLAFHSSIKESFEFLMKTWIRNANIPEDGGGFDPVLDRRSSSPINLFNNRRPFQLQVPGGWVTPTGSEYMFMPSISFLRSLGPAPIA